MRMGGADGLVVATPKFNAIDWINFWWEFYTSAAVDMCSNGSRGMYAYEILAVQSVKFLGGTGVISGRNF